MSALLETRGLGIRFGGLRAVQGLDLRVGAAEILALIGEVPSADSALSAVLVRLRLIGHHLYPRGDGVFGGDDTTFFALDSHNGKPLWSVETGSRINAAPVTYSANGEQFVAIAAGGVLFTFALPPAAVPAP